MRGDGLLFVSSVMSSRSMASGAEYLLGQRPTQLRLTTPVGG